MMQVASHPAEPRRTSRTEPARPHPGHRSGPSLAFVVALGLAAAAFAVLAFLARGAPYFAFDLPLARAIQGIDVPGFATALTVSSWIGFPPQIAIATALIAAGLWLTGHRRAAIVLLVAGAGGALLWYVLGGIIDRPRPDPALIRVEHAASGHSSFPSGHALNVTAIFGFLWYLAFTLARPAWLRVATLVLLALPVVTVGVARVWDGHHWPSDVLGGYLLGGILLALAIACYRRTGHTATSGTGTGGQRA